MESTLTNLLKNIVNHPDDVNIEREEQEIGKVLFKISLNDEDKGIVIGKGGKTIKALNNIMAVKGIKENKRVFLKVL